MSRNLEDKEQTRVLSRSKPFILGKCQCGCGEDIPIRRKDKGHLQKFRHGHNRRGSGLEVHIIYLGDFDPSGEDISRHIRQGLNFFGLKKIPIDRLAVTKNQIEQFYLPPVPTDKDTIEKLEQRDRRTPGFIERHGRLYAVELEALSYKPEFRQLLINTVDKLYVKSIYQELLSRPEHSPDAISRLVQKEVNFLNDP